MQKLLLLIFFISSFSFAQQQEVTFSVVPAEFEEDETITITASDFNPGIWGVSEVYLWAWSTANGVQEDSPTNGDMGQLK